MLQCSHCCPKPTEEKPQTLIKTANSLLENIFVRLSTTVVYLNSRGEPDKNNTYCILCQMHYAVQCSRIIQLRSVIMEKRQLIYVDACFF